MKKFKSKIIRVFIAISLVVVFTLPASASTTNGTIDSTDKYAWSENVGWINFGTTEGNVQVTDSALSGYAWNPKIGWISLNCSNDSSCATVDHGIANDGAGNLSGYAWSENFGWINFDPSNGGVIINSSGEFSGYAFGPKIGWIVFNCDTTSSCATVDYKTKTDWRPQASRPQCNNAIDDDDDGVIDYPNDGGCSSLNDDDEINPGGGLPPGAGSSPLSPTPTVSNPEVDFSVIINNGLKYTNNKKVNLKFNTGNDTTKMAISNNSDFSGASQIPYQEEIDWEFTECNTPPDISQDGDICTVYVKFYTQYGVSSETVLDSIILFMDPPEIELTQAKEIYFTDEVIVISGITKSNSVVVCYLDGKLLDDKLQSDEDGDWTISFGNLEEGFYKIRIISRDFAENFSNPLEVSFVVKEKEIISIEKDKTGAEDKNEADDNDSQKEADNSDDEEIIDNLINRDETKDSEDKISDEKDEGEISVEEVADTLQSIKKIVPLSSFNKFRNWTEKFDSIEKTLGFSRNVDLVDNNKLSEITFSLPGFSAAKEENENNKIPTEVVFARVSNEKIDLQSILSFDQDGDLGQKINVIAGKKISLAIRPEYPVENIKGYFVFKSGYAEEDNGNISFDSYLKKITKKAIAKEDVEEFLVLNEFEYFDLDGDGIYTVEVESPKTKGDYEIVTMINYQDHLLGTKMIKLTTIIDPEGYVFEKNGNKETRIPNATVFIYKLNPQTDQYEIWQAEKYDQINPQVTNHTGEYSFLVPEGTYYIQAQANEYLSYKSDSFEVREGEGINFNIELKIEKSYFDYFDFKIILIIILSIFLFISFYRNKKRKIA